MESVLFECLALGVDAFLFGLCWKSYLNKSKNAKAVQEAPVFGIDNKLCSKVKDSANSIPYAVVRGTVKATSNSLQSQYLPNLKAVIREKIIKERKMKWSSVLRIWTTVEQDIERSHSSTPFALLGNGRWFKSSVEVVDPLVAEELLLTTVYDHFVPHEDSIGEAVAGWFHGERITGIREIENLLTEGSVLTGIGELIVDGDSVKLKPPQQQYTYFLTAMSLDSIIKKFKEEANFFKVLSFLLGCVGIFLMSTILKKAYQARKQRLEAAKQRERHQEARRLRRRTDPSRSADSAEDRGLPLCVICLTNPVEVIILECGHTCLCLDCNEHVRDYCPVCRSPIERTVSAYLP